MKWDKFTSLKIELSRRLQPIFHTKYWLCNIFQNIPQSERLAYQAQVRLLPWTELCEYGHALGGNDISALVLQGAAEPQTFAARAVVRTSSAFQRCDAHDTNCPELPDSWSIFIWISINFGSSSVLKARSSTSLETRLLNSWQYDPYQIYIDHFRLHVR